MTKRMWIIFGSLAGALLLALVLFNYVFSIYETKFDVTRDVLYADGAATATITATPINAWGFKAPFRKGMTKYIIEEGADKVDVLINDEVNGVFSIRSKLIAGKVVIRATPAKSLFPTKFELEIYPNTAIEDSLAAPRMRYTM